MSRRASVPPAIEELLKKKATHSDCTYKVSAVAFDKHGDILGHCTNSHAKWDVLSKGKGRPRTALHAERRLIERYSGLVKTIVICRVGRSGTLRAIDPCPMCQKVANKYGVKIKSIMPG